MVWIYNDPLRFDQDERLLKRKIGNDDLANLWSCFKYLKAHPPASADVLHKSLFFDRAQVLPILDKETAEKVFSLLQTIRNPELYRTYLKEQIEKRRLQSGGGEFEDRMLNKFISIVSGPLTNMLGLDPNADTPQGILVRIAYNLAEFASNFVFLLKTLEDNPMVGGPLWTLLLDGVDKNIPKLTAGLESIMTQVSILLAPIGIGFATEAIALIIGTVLALSHTLINLSRRKFGSALVAFLGIVPVVGPFMILAIHSLSDTYEEYNEKREQLRQIPLIGDSLANFDPLE
jgi:hypothetical protein